jgi:hypothetical protein
MSALSALQPAPELAIVVVEDHHHLLTHLHYLLRQMHRRSLKNHRGDDATMSSVDVPRSTDNPSFILVHFDSHPDLSFPYQLPTSTIEQPPKLLDSLDDSLGGIAEWILPLCFKGHVSEMRWYKQAGVCTQIVDGCHQLLVGEVEGKVRLDEERRTGGAKRQQHITCNYN